MKQKKILLNPNYIQISILKAKVEKQRPLFNRLKEIADAEGLKIDDEIGKEYLKKHTKDNAEFLPIEVLKLKGKIEPYNEINNLSKSIEHLPLYKSDDALNQYIKENIHTYSDDPYVLKAVDLLQPVIKFYEVQGLNRLQIAGHLANYGVEHDSYGEGYFYNYRINNLAKKIK